jgi:DNA-binding NarL/FixJ family response regulator
MGCSESFVDSPSRLGWFLFSKVSMPIRVMIADDVAAVRRGLELAVKAFDDLELIGAAADGREAMELSKRLNPDVVLLDAEMPHLCSVAAARLIRWLQPQTQVIVLLAFGDDEMARKLGANGINHCLYKNVSADELAGAIRDAYQRTEQERGQVHPMPTFPCPGAGCPRDWHCSN